MEIPKKIYVREFTDSLCQMWTMQPGKKRNDKDLVYINRDELLALLDAEKEETSIGLCEYDAGHENGRMEVIMSLTEKIKAL